MKPTAAGRVSPLVIGLLTFLAFTPVLRFGFIEWDDWLNLVTIRTIGD